MRYKNDEWKEEVNLEEIKIYSNTIIGIEGFGDVSNIAVFLEKSDGKKDIRLYYLVRETITEAIGEGTFKEKLCNYVKESTIYKEL